MLAPDSRQTLLDQLRPPRGYRLEHCVGTTFTLDLASALVPPLAFTSLGLQGTRDPVHILSALRDVADRIDLFCQAGQIVVPREASNLFAYLEPMVHQMTPPKPGHLFHPKVWLSKYTLEQADGDLDSDEIADDSGLPVTVFRLLVLSRNLTRDSSWDTVVSLDGQPGSARDATNRPLAEFLRYLTREGSAVHPLPPSRTARIEALDEAVRRMVWERPADVDDIRFHAFGFPGAQTADFSGMRSVVVSPFITSGGLALTARTRGESVVISTAEALDQLDVSTAETIGSAFVLSPDADLRDIEAMDDEGPTAGRNRDNDESPVEDHSGAVNRHRALLSGLHAKIYCVERNRRAFLFLGSANATGPAFGGNVEFLVEFEGKVKDLGMASLLGTDSLGAIIVEYPKPFGGKEPSEDDEARRRLANVIRAIAAIPMTATVTPVAGSVDADMGAASDIASGLYTVTVTGTRPVPMPPGFTASAQLHTRRGEAISFEPGQPMRLCFPKVSLVDLTAFVVIDVVSPEGLEGGCVIVADLVGAPEERLDAIIAAQLDSPEKFLRFLALLLGFSHDAAFAEQILGNGSEGRSARRTVPGLFEQLVRGVADNPVSLRNLGGIIARIEKYHPGQSVLPEGFATLWAVIDEALQKMEG